MQGNKGLYHQTEQQLNSEQEIIEAAKKAVSYTHLTLPTILLV